jgi:chromate transport protein ChrA
LKKKLSSGKRRAGLDSPIAILLQIAVPDFIIAVSLSLLLAVTPSIVVTPWFKILSPVLTAMSFHSPLVDNLSLFFLLLICRRLYQNLGS